MKDHYWGKRWCYSLVRLDDIDKQFGLTFWWNSGRAGVALQFWMWEVLLTREWEKGL